MSQLLKLRKIVNSSNWCVTKWQLYPHLLPVCSIFTDCSLDWLLSFYLYSLKVVIFKGRKVSVRVLLWFTDCFGHWIFCCILGWKSLVKLYLCVLCAATLLLSSSFFGKTSTRIPRYLTVHVNGEIFHWLVPVLNLCSLVTWMLCISAVESNEI